MTEWLRTIDIYFSTESDGYRQSTPVIHYFGRDTSWQRHHIKVDTVRPYFLVRQSEWTEIGHQLGDDDRVMSVETTDLRGRIERTIDGEPLIRVVCREPSDVGDLRELVDDPFEADVLFPTRFLIDVGDTQWLGVDESVIKTEEPCSTEDIVLPGEETETPEMVPPLRNCLYDIEVQQTSDGPPVVSEEGTERADNDITAITAYDNFTTEYHSWILIHSEWSKEDVQAVREFADDCRVPLDVNLYDNPRDVVAQFCEWVIERDFDSLCGWNAGSFDHPYLVNYGLSNGVGSIKELSPTGEVYPMNGDGNFINSQLKGRLLLDLMELYSKTEVSELSSYRLSNIAEQEDVSVGKLDLTEVIDVPDDEPAIDHAWKEYPERFVEYSVKDVRACVGINSESKKNVNII